MNHDDDVFVSWVRQTSSSCYHVMGSTGTGSRTFIMLSYYHVVSLASMACYQLLSSCEFDVHIML
jgi:hypothetical protein